MSSPVPGPTAFARALCMAAALAASIALTPPGAQAATFQESGDAGDTVASAMNTGQAGAPQPLSTLIGAVLSSLDADLFLIHITDGASFSAVASAATQLFDPQLFLLTMSGVPVVLNDDAAGGLTTLPALAGVTGLTEGFYLLGVSRSGYNPVNAVNQLLFAPGLPTELRYAASGLQPDVLGGFSDDAPMLDSGTYEIGLTGVDTFVTAAVPEPASGLLLGLGCGVVAWQLRHRRAGRQR